MMQTSTEPIRPCSQENIQSEQIKEKKKAIIQAKLQEFSANRERDNRGRFQKIRKPNRKSKNPFPKPSTEVLNDSILQPEQSSDYMMAQENNQSAQITQSPTLSVKQIFKVTTTSQKSVISGSETVNSAKFQTGGNVPFIVVKCQGACTQETHQQFSLSSGSPKKCHLSSIDAIEKVQIKQQIKSKHCINQQNKVISRMQQSQNSDSQINNQTKRDAADFSEADIHLHESRENPMMSQLTFGGARDEMMQSYNFAAPHNNGGVKQQQPSAPGNRLAQTLQSIEDRDIIDIQLDQEDPTIIENHVSPPTGILHHHSDIQPILAPSSMNTLPSKSRQKVLRAQSQNVDNEVPQTIQDNQLMRHSRGDQQLVIKDSISYIESGSQQMTTRHARKVTVSNPPQSSSQFEYSTGRQVRESFQQRDRRSSNCHQTQDEPASQGIISTQKISKSKLGNTQADLCSKTKKSGQNQYEECLKIYQKMFWFDWDLKDIVNSRHSPRDDLTTGAFWFYFNTTFFPHDLQTLLTESSFEEWVQPILDNLQNFNSPEEQTAINQINEDSDQEMDLKVQNKLLNPESQQSQISENQKQTKASHVDKLIGKRRRFTKFKQHFAHLKKRAETQVFDDETMLLIQSEASKIPKLDENDYDSEKENSQNVDQEIAEIKCKIQKQDFQKMLLIAEQDLEITKSRNIEMLQNLWNEVREKYLKAMSIEKGSADYKDMNLYKGQDIHCYNQQFLSYVDPAFVQDMIANKEWYAQNCNQFLLNINYPCKLQTDFLKMIELSQQRRNDQKYRKILDQMDQIEHMQQRAEAGDISANEEIKKKELEKGLQQLSMKQRAQIAQEDACCAICGVGDYEDDDQIVFCCQCSMPVHQSCFGIETIPEIDWICNNCLTFGFQRGLMVKCFLCPKRGGAMKPTNVFQNQEKFYEQKIKNLTKKSSKAEKKEPKIIETLEDLDPGNENSRSQVLKRLENNTSLTELLQREVAYRERILREYDDALIAIELAKKDPSLTANELTPAQLIIKEQEEFEFNFNKHEKQNHNTPEDYANFIKRNEQALELKATPITDTLYNWVHHSCAMWMQGPIVTPKTPVKMHKMDFSKFNQGCVICGKKGYQIGAVVKCQKQECQIQFHVECAKRSNYCMEIEKKSGSNNRERVFKIFCESHRPFKIIQVINEQNQKEIEDIQKFTKTIEKALEIQQKQVFKPKKIISKADKIKMLRQAIQSKKQELVQKKKESKFLGKPKKLSKVKPIKVKKWREIDKKTLVNRIKEKYLTIMKMRLNLVKVDPMIAETKRYQYQLRRIQKQEEKKRKQDMQQKMKQEIIDLQKERESKIQERGLRNRLRESSEQFNQVDLANDAQIEDSIGLEAEEKLEFPHEEMTNQEVQQSNQTNNKIVLNLESAEQEAEDLDSVMSDKVTDHENEQDDGFPELREIPAYFKHASPLTLKELEWTVTLSRYDFPWNEIAFEPFSPRDCYKMYVTMVTNASSFLKKVLGDKIKYQKIMQNQINGLPTYDMMVNMKLAKKNKQQNLGFNQPVQKQRSPDPIFGIQHFLHDRGQQQAYGSILPTTDAVLINPNLYCRCKGYIQQEFMVACESGEDLCVNGGWMHPQCTSDLCNLTQEQIDDIEVWYCEDCIIRRNQQHHRNHSQGAEFGINLEMSQGNNAGSFSHIEKISSPSKDTNQKSLIVSIDQTPQEDKEMKVSFRMSESQTSQAFEHSPSQNDMQIHNMFRAFKQSLMHMSANQQSFNSMAGPDITHTFAQILGQFARGQQEGDTTISQEQVQLIIHQLMQSMNPQHQ